MKGVIIIACLLALTQGYNLKASVGKQCNTNLNQFTVTSFTVVPWPLAKNTNVVANMTGTFNSAQTLKALYLNAKVDGVLPFSTTLPQSGSYVAGQSASFITKQLVPSFAPGGTYVVQVGLQNTAGTDLNCWEIDFKL